MEIFPCEPMLDEMAAMDCGIEGRACRRACHALVSEPAIEARRLRESFVETRRAMWAMDVLSAF